MAAQLLVVLRAGRGHRWPTLPNLWRGNAVQLVLLAVALSAANYARTAISPLQEQIRLALALSDNQIGLLQGPAMALPVALGAVPLGLLVDRVSRARLLIVLVTLTTLANGFSALAPSFGALLAARCSIGLTAAATSITVLSLLADRYAPAQRGRATMVVTVGEVGGASGAFALGGWLLGESGPDRWHAAMLWLTVPLVIATLSMLLLSEPARSRVAIDPRSLRGGF